IALAAETVALDTLTLGTTTGSPTLGCGATTCAAVQAGGPAATLVPADGTITRLRVRHGAIDGGGILATEGALHVLSRAGTSYTVKASAALTFTATEAADSLSTFEVDLAVAAGDYLGLEIRGAYAQSRPLFLAEGTQAD